MGLVGFPFLNVVNEVTPIALAQIATIYVLKKKINWILPFSSATPLHFSSFIFVRIQVDFIGYFRKYIS